MKLLEPGGRTLGNLLTVFFSKKAEVEDLCSLLKSVAIRDCLFMARKPSTSPISLMVLSEIAKTRLC
jgi:hypothetical protein